MNKEELALHFLQEYYNIPTHWEDYKIIHNALQENQKLKKQLEASEKARKDAMDLIEKLRFEKWAITGTDIIEVMDILDLLKEIK